MSVYDDLDNINDIFEDEDDDLGWDDLETLSSSSDREDEDWEDDEDEDEE